MEYGGAAAEISPTGGDGGNRPHTVLFPAFHSDYAVANREVARVVVSCPNRFYGFAFVHSDRDRGRVFAMVKVAVEQYGFRGIKVHRYDGRVSTVRY